MYCLFVHMIRRSSDELCNFAWDHHVFIVYLIEIDDKESGWIGVLTILHHTIPMLVSYSARLVEE